MFEMVGLLQRRRMHTLVKKNDKNGGQKEVKGGHYSC